MLPPWLNPLFFLTPGAPAPGSGPSGSEQAVGAIRALSLLSLSPLSSLYAPFLIHILLLGLEPGMVATISPRKEIK